MVEGLFQDQDIIKKIQTKLPELFQIAELESSRAGKIGMEVGSIREKILIALLVYKIGRENVQTDLPIHEPEADVIVHGNSISIKTVTGRRIGGVKLIWTVDHDQAVKFSEEYVPTCDMLLAHINWGGAGALYLFTKQLQAQLLEQLGREEYMKLPKPGTNPRGVEITTNAIRILANHPQSLIIPVQWEKIEIVFDPYKRWLELWKQE
ncbi:MAG: ThaI family type II restriction endonuclease [Chloroflexota bacterium]|nr:ThaI family type II restriction endonuclease [Chloroflexota bacterium]